MKVLLRDIIARGQLLGSAHQANLLKDEELVIDQRIGRKMDFYRDGSIDPEKWLVTNFSKLPITEKLDRRANNYYAINSFISE